MYKHTLPDNTVIEIKDAVPEKDLMALKSGLETANAKVKVLEERLIGTDKDHQSALNAKHQETLQLQAKLEQLEKDTESFNKTKGDLAKAIKDHTDYKKSQETIAGTLLATKKQILSIKYGITEDKLKDKTLDQLSQLEDAATVLGLKGSGPKGMDVSSLFNHPAGDPISTTEKIKAGFEALHPTK